MEFAKERNQGKVQDLVENWQGNNLNFSFKTYGFDVSGTVAVEPNAVRIDSKIPFAAMMFKGKIEQTLKDELAKLLASPRAAARA